MMCHNTDHTDYLLSRVPGRLVQLLANASNFCVSYGKGGVNPLVFTNCHVGTLFLK